jgi:hypothetical protein
MSRFVVLLLALLAPIAFARPPARVPTDANEVLEHLPHGYAALEPRAERAPIPTLADAAALLTTAARTGDARLARRADALLARLPDDGAAASLKVRAFAAQHRHDFSVAAALLDRAIAIDPRDADLRLSRVQVALVQGRVREARRACGALALGIDAARGEVCTAAIALRTGRLEVAARLSEQWLRGATQDDALRAYVLLVRAESAARAGEAGADRWFRAAIATDPADVRNLSAFARYLLAHDRADEVRPLLGDAGDSDGIAQLRALAAVANGDGDADALVRAQADRFALSHRLGMPTELRDEAELALTVQADAPRGLALALANFRDQRDHEDVRLLLRAAALAKSPQSLAPMRAWAAAEGIVVAVAP